MTQPVRPLPPLQCTTATCRGSESSHDLIDLHTLQRFVETNNAVSSQEGDTECKFCQYTPFVVQSLIVTYTCRKEPMCCLAVGTCTHECLPQYIPYSGKLSREKTFTNFALLEPSVKAFSMKFGACCTHLQQVLVFREIFFLTEMVTLTDLRKFSPQKVSRYTVCRVLPRII